MFIENLLNQNDVGVMTEMLKFTSAREKLIAQNVVNIDTPNYVQKDLSLEKFQQLLHQRVQQAGSAAPGSVRFDDIDLTPENSPAGILFHDGNNRSIEQLESDQAKNALMHNMIVEMLKNQFSMMEMALREKVS